MPNFYKTIIDMFIDFCSTATAKDILDAVHAADDIRKEFDASHALIAASAKNTPEVISALISAGMNPNTRSYDGSTPLMWAAMGNSAEAVSILLKAGADVNASRSDGLNALIAASKNNTPAVISLLLKAGANIDAMDKGGMTALMWAETGKTCSEEVMKLLQRPIAVHAPFQMRLT